MVCALAAPALAQIQFKAYCTTTAPAQNYTFDTGGASTANVSPVCINVKIEITGAGSGQQFYLSWNMVAHVNDTPVSGDVNDTVVTCSQAGYWSRSAKGTGTLMGTLAVAPTQSGVAGAYVSVYNVGDPTQNATKNDNRNVTVVNP